jgi:hypothetical protein
MALSWTELLENTSKTGPFVYPDCSMSILYMENQPTTALVRFPLLSDFAEAEQV